MSLPGYRRTVDADQPIGPNRRVGATQTANLGEILERVLDKGIVIAGDITISLGEVEILNIKVRLLIASIDKAQEIGINWWQSDPALSSRAKKLAEENRLLRERLDSLERRLAPPDGETKDRVAAEPEKDTEAQQEEQEA
ncbi:MAG TPA: gas vesicle protein [Ktedonobacterales bacterium]